MYNNAVNWRINCGFYINICCFISDFRPVVTSITLVRLSLCKVERGS